MVVQGNLLKEPRKERWLHVDWTTKISCSEKWWDNSECISVDGISHLLRHFRQVLTFEKSSEHRNLSVGVVGSTLIKILWIEDGQNSMPPKWLSYPEFLLGPNQATTDARNLCHLNNSRSANCEWKKVHCKSAQTIFALNVKYWDCRLFVSETFFYAKNENKKACFCLFSWMLRTGISSFATENAIKSLLNRVFLLLHGMLKFQVIINGDNLIVSLKSCLLIWDHGIIGKLSFLWEWLLMLPAPKG